MSDFTSGRRAVAFAVALAIVPALVQAQGRADQPDPPVVTTTGEATVEAAPDVAWMTVRAETRAGNPRDAQRRNAEAMQPVLDALRGAGIPANAIRTIGYDLEQEWDFVNDRRVSRGFVARNTVEVKVDDIARLGELLGLAVDSGATTVMGIRFDVKGRDALEREAIRMAVGDARARAEAAASGAGMTVERVLRIDTQPIGRPQPLPQFAMARAAEDAAGPPISSGQIQIRVQVTLTSALK